MKRHYGTILQGSLTPMAPAYEINSDFVLFKMCKKTLSVQNLNFAALKVREILQYTACCEIEVLNGPNFKNSMVTMSYVLKLPEEHRVYMGV
jgi:hypothetical protein